MIARCTLLGLVLASTWPGCAGEANRSKDGPGGDLRADLAGLERWRAPDRTPDADLCAAFAKEGQSCDTQACPAGLIRAVLGGTACTCQVPCNPDQAKRCTPESCGRVCVQLTDSGKPLPGQGACVLDKGGGPGEPCSPGVCKLDLQCMQQALVSFCRQTCTGASDCTGYKMVCVPLSTGGTQVCIPEGATVGPKLGESCAAASAYCVQELLCDPQSKTCLTPCSPSGGCTSPATCTKLVDTASGVVVGYGCR